MDGLEYQIEQLQMALSHLDLHRHLPEREASELQMALAKATALTRLAASRQTGTARSQDLIQLFPISQAAITDARLLSTTEPMTTAAQATLNGQETLATVATACGVTRSVLRDYNPHLSEFLDDEPLPPNTYVKVRCPPNLRPSCRPSVDWALSMNSSLPRPSKEASMMPSAQTSFVTPKPIGHTAAARDGHQGGGGASSSSVDLPACSETTVSVGEGTPTGRCFTEETSPLSSWIASPPTLAPPPVMRPITLTGDGDDGSPGRCSGSMLIPNPLCFEDAVGVTLGEAVMTGDKPSRSSVAREPSYAGSNRAVDDAFSAPSCSASPARNERSPSIQEVTRLPIRTGSMDAAERHAGSSVMPTLSTPSHTLSPRSERPVSTERKGLSIEDPCATTPRSQEMLSQMNGGYCHPVRRSVPTPSSASSSSSADESHRSPSFAVPLTLRGVPGSQPPKITGGSAGRHSDTERHSTSVSPGVSASGVGAPVWYPPQPRHADDQPPRAEPRAVQRDGDHPTAPTVAPSSVGNGFSMLSSSTYRSEASFVSNGVDITHETDGEDESTSYPPSVTPCAVNTAGRLSLLPEPRPASVEQTPAATPSLTQTRMVSKSGSPPIVAASEARPEVGDGAADHDSPQCVLPTSASAVVDDTDNRSGYGSGDESEFDTIEAISKAYAVSVDEVIQWNPYLAVYRLDEPLPPDLLIVLRQGGDGPAEEGAIPESSSPAVDERAES